jgi:ATP-dependent DNA ligase
MLTRYPDSPVMSGPDILPTLADGDYLVQYKVDGWRCVAERQPDGRWTFTSRHDKALPVTSVLRRRVEPLLEHLPPGTMLDGEYLGRRPPVVGEEQFIAFDVMRHGAEWHTRKGAGERFRLLMELVPDELIVGHDFGDYPAFFESAKQLPTAEGIVLKHVASPYIGSVRKCAENRQWLKIRHRGGASNETPLVA